MRDFFNCIVVKQNVKKNFFFCQSNCLQHFVTKWNSTNVFSPGFLGITNIKIVSSFLSWLLQFALSLLQEDLSDHGRAGQANHQVNMATIYGTIQNLSLYVSGAIWRAYHWDSSYEKEIFHIDWDFRYLKMYILSRVWDDLDMPAATLSFWRCLFSMGPLLAGLYMLSLTWFHCTWLEITWLAMTLYDSLYLTWLYLTLPDLTCLD